jgi:DNA-binding response OmpR family regulator
MRIQREQTYVFPVLLLEPNGQNAAELAAVLGAAGFEVTVSADARSALQALQKAFFFALIVVADLTDPACLRTLSTLRQRAPRSWMIVATTVCDAHACDLIHRHGGDACVVLTASLEDLVGRLNAFHVRARPSF